MRLTQFTDYTLRVLMHLAVHRHERVTIRSIAEAWGVSRNHLMKVVNGLTRNGLVEASRGKGGGLRLAVAPERVSIGPVVRDAEGSDGLVECGQCRISDACRLACVLGEALDAFNARLDRVSLADLVGRPDRLRRLLAA